MRIHEYHLALSNMDQDTSSPQINITDTGSKLLLTVASLVLLAGSFKFIPQRADVARRGFVWFKVTLFLFPM